MIYNLVFIIFQTRTDPIIKNVSLEINYSFGVFVSAIAPIIIDLGQEATLITFWLFALLSIFTIRAVGPRKDQTTDTANPKMTEDSIQNET